MSPTTSWRPTQCSRATKSNRHPPTHQPTKKTIHPSTIAFVPQSAMAFFFIPALRLLALVYSTN